MNRSITDKEIFALWMLSDNRYPLSFFDTHMKFVDRYLNNALYPEVKNSFTRQLYNGDMRLGYWVGLDIPEKNHVDGLDYAIHLTGILHNLPQSLQKNAEFSHYIEDPWCFVPTKEFIMMIHAQIWYRMNRDQFE